MKKNKTLPAELPAKKFPDLYTYSIRGDKKDEKNPPVKQSPVNASFHDNENKHTSQDAEIALVS